MILSIIHPFACFKKRIYFSNYPFVYSNAFILSQYLVFTQIRINHLVYIRYLCIHSIHSIFHSVPSSSLYVVFIVWVCVVPELRMLKWAFESALCRAMPATFITGPHNHKKPPSRTNERRHPSDAATAAAWGWRWRRSTASIILSACC